MDLAIPVYILNGTVCILHSVNTFKKGMNPTILPPAMGSNKMNKFKKYKSFHGPSYFNIYNKWFGFRFTEIYLIIMTGIWRISDIPNNKTLWL